MEVIFPTFEFLMYCNAYADILDWMSKASLALQTDQGGKSINEAANVIEKLRLKLAKLHTRPGVLEQSTLFL